MANGNAGTTVNGAEIWANVKAILAATPSRTYPVAPTPTPAARPATAAFWYAGFYGY